MDSERLTVIPLFADLTPEQRALVAEKATEHAIEIGQVLTKEADLSSRFFAIASGRAAVTTDDGFAALLGPGDVIGEMGAIRKAKRSANVVAITDMSVVGLMGWDLRDLVAAIPELDAALRDTIDRRLAELEPDRSS
ncbi:MAG: cyclic nucleotide-binding domain-containing protein [Acidimicrobiia bacterium]